MDIDILDCPNCGEEKRRSTPLCEQCAEKRLALQREALSLYCDGDMHDPEMTDTTVDEDGQLAGDTLALFVWREIGEAWGDREHAVDFMRRAANQLELLADALSLPKQEEKQS